MLKENNLVNEVEEAITPIMHSYRFELVGVEWARKQGRWNLCIYMDKPGGITIDDCENVHHEISDLLDRVDLIPHSYVLEVSSPGLDRSLRKREDFIKFNGDYAKITTDVPINGQKRFKGLLRGLEDDCVLLENREGQVKAIPFKTVIKANLWYKPDFKEYERRRKKK